MTSQYVDLSSLNLGEKLSNRRSQAVSHITEEELQEIQKMEEEIVKEEKAPEVGNIILQANIIDQIIDCSQEITEKTEFDFSLLD